MIIRRVNVIRGVSYMRMHPRTISMLRRGAQYGIYGKDRNMDPITGAEIYSEDLEKGGEANEAQRAHLHQSREQWANYTDQERGNIIIQQKYNRAINDAFKANDYDLAYDSFLDMIEDGVAPTTATYRTLISGWSVNRSGLLANNEDVMAFFERARSSGIQLELEMYSRLIGILCRSNNTNYWPLVNRVYSEMIRDGYAPDEFVYSHIIGMVSKKMGFDIAQKYIQECRERLGHVPIMCWRGLCNGASRGNNVQMISRGIVDVVVDLNLPPGETTVAFNSILSRLGASSQWGVSKDMTENQVKDVAIKVAMESVRVYERMLKETSSVPNEDTYTLVSSGLVQLLVGRIQAEDKDEIMKTIATKLFSLQDERRAKGMLMTYEELDGICAIAADYRDFDTLAKSVHEMYNCGESMTDSTRLAVKKALMHTAENGQTIKSISDPTVRDSFEAVVADIYSRKTTSKLKSLFVNA